MKALIFLCYLSRSGSTFLSKELNKYSDIKVSIEGEFFDGYARPILKINNDNDLKQYLDRLYNERPCKLKYWGIDRNGLFHSLKQIDYPITFNKILYQILDMYFNGIEEDEIIIYKAGDYHKHTDQIIKEFGTNVKFLFINRDPRSIYNSQKKSLGSETGKPFIANIEKFVKKYKEEHKYIQQNLGRNNFYIIKYEDLIADKKTTLLNVLKFLESNGVKKKVKNNYFAKIPENQKKLHAKLNSSEDKTRIKPWDIELPPKETFLLQKYLARYLIKYDYTFAPFSFSRHLKYWFPFLVSKLRYYRMHSVMPIVKKNKTIYKCYKLLVNRFK